MMDTTVEHDNKIRNLKKNPRNLRKRPPFQEAAKSKDQNYCS